MIPALQSSRPVPGLIAPENSIAKQALGRTPFSLRRRPHPGAPSASDRHAGKKRRSTYSRCFALHSFLQASPVGRFRLAGHRVAPAALFDVSPYGLPRFGSRRIGEFFQNRFRPCVKRLRGGPRMSSSIVARSSVSFAGTKESTNGNQNLAVLHQA